MWALLRLRDPEELPMQTVTTIGLDIGKAIFQLPGVDAAGEVVIRHQLKLRSVLAVFQKTILARSFRQLTWAIQQM
jgi:hypothetical protein